MNSKHFTFHSLFKSIVCFCSALLLLTAAGSPERCEAATYNYPTQYVEITVSDNVLIMTPATSKYDDVWAKAGVSDPSSMLDEFKEMGVTAAFFNPDNRLTVKFIAKRSTATAEAFSFTEKSDEEITAFMNGVVNATDADGLNVSLTVRRDLNNTVPFIRMVLDARTAQNPCSEIIYATVINGQLLQFDAFTEGVGENDDSFAEEIVKGVTFTRIMTMEDYEAELESARIKLAIISVCLICAIAGIIILSVFFRKRREKRMRSISDAMTDFRNRLHNGEINTNETPHYTFTTKYDTALMDEFGIFSAWFNPEPGFALAMIIFAVLAVAMIMENRLLYALLTIVLIIVMLYIHYSQAEKNKDALSRRYSVKEKPTAVFKFYDEYFHVSGLPTAGEYIYGQVTGIRSFGHAVYIFVGDAQALIIRKEDLGSVHISELRQLIRKKS